MEAQKPAREATVFAGWCLKIRPAPWKKKNYSSWDAAFGRRRMVQDQGARGQGDQAAFERPARRGGEGSARRFVAAMVNWPRQWSLKQGRTALSPGPGLYQQGISQNTLEEVARTKSISLVFQQAVQGKKLKLAGT